MNDHTDDAPRERYEGPMASAAKAETRDCEACHGYGYRWKSKGTDRYTYSCECTGVPDVPIDEPFTVPDPEFRNPNATGHDGCIRGLEKANATIAEQLAEIERLKGELDYLGKMAKAYQETAEERGAERDRWRLEVQRLKDLSFEAQDRYAALEAYKDAIADNARIDLEQAVANTRAECDKGYEALFQAHQRMVAERDELRLEVARLRDRLCLEKGSREHE